MPWILKPSKRAVSTVLRIFLMGILFSTEFIHKRKFFRRALDKVANTGLNLFSSIRWPDGSENFSMIRIWIRIRKKSFRIRTGQLKSEMNLK
jgi:hypothetical protein